MIIGNRFNRITEYLLLIILHHKPILQLNLSIGHGSELIVVCYNYKSLTELVSKFKEEIVQLNCILGIEIAGRFVR